MGPLLLKPNDHIVSKSQVFRITRIFVLNGVLKCEGVFVESGVQGAVPFYEIEKRFDVCFDGLPLRVVEQVQWDGQGMYKGTRKVHV